MRLAVALIILAVLSAAVLSSHQHKPFPLLVDAADAAMIVCNPVLTGIPSKPRKVVRA